MGKKDKKKNKGEKKNSKSLSLNEKKLFYHVKHRNIPRIKHYLEKEKVNPQIYDKDDWSLLHHAINLNHPQIAAYLIEKGVNKNWQCRFGSFKGWTAMHIAASNGFKDVLEILMGYGCDMGLKNASKKTPAKISKNKRIKKLLDEKNQKKLMQIVRRKRLQRKEERLQKKEEDAINKEVDEFSRQLKARMGGNKNDDKLDNLKGVVKEVVGGGNEKGSAVYIKKIKGLSAAIGKLKKMLDATKLKLEESEKKNEELMKKSGGGSGDTCLNLENDLHKEIYELVKTERVLVKLNTTMGGKEYTSENERRCTKVLEKIEKKGGSVLGKIKSIYERKIQETLFMINDKRKVEEKEESFDSPKFDYLTRDFGKQMKKRRDLKIPNMYICPLSGELMKDPVTLVESGTNYERSIIEDWLKNNGDDPLSGIQLSSKQLQANIALRVLVEEWKKNNNM